ncbi:Hypothetical protein GSB_16613 [Giardia duodenalis]|uniref:Uncharacterized protein n=1 Tax=Giardia intestinalis TaxID=5741 RepID=V6TUQ5_GIAIN|nr:Hypothetical protein GSB_16613 [Giardia intestinalis]
MLLIKTPNMVSLTEFLSNVTQNPDAISSWEPLRSGSLEKLMSVNQHCGLIRTYLSIFPTDPEMGAIFIETLLNKKDPLLYTELCKVIQIAPTATVFGPLIRHSFSKINVTDATRTGIPHVMSLAALAVLFAPYDPLGSIAWKVLCNVTYTNKQVDLSLLIMELLSTIPLASIMLPSLRLYAQLTNYCRVAGIDTSQPEEILKIYVEDSALPATDSQGEPLDLVPTLNQLIRFCTVVKNYSLTANFALKRHVLMCNAMGVPSNMQQLTHGSSLSFKSSGRWPNNSIPGMNYVHTSSDKQKQLLSNLLWNEVIDFEMKVCSILINNAVINEVEAARRVLFCLETAVQFQPSGTTYFSLLSYIIELLRVGHDSLAYDSNDTEKQCFNELVNLTISDHWDEAELGALHGLVGGRPANLWHRLRRHLDEAVCALVPKAQQIISLKSQQGELTPYGVFDLPGLLPTLSSEHGADVDHDSDDSETYEQQESMQKDFDSIYRRSGCCVKKPTWTLSTMQRCQGIPLTDSVPEEFYSPHPCMQNNNISTLIVLVLDFLAESNRVKTPLFNLLLQCLYVYAFTSLNFLACGAYLKHSLILKRAESKDAMLNTVLVTFGCCDSLLTSAVLYHYYNVISTSGAQIKDKDDTNNISQKSNADAKEIVYDCIPIRAFTIFAVHITDMAIKFSTTNGSANDTVLTFLRALFNQGACFITCTDHPPVLNLDFAPLLCEYIHQLYEVKHMQELTRLFGTDRKGTGDTIMKTSNHLYLQCPPLTLSSVQALAGLLSKTLGSLNGEPSSGFLSSTSLYRPEIYTLFPLQEGNMRLSVEVCDTLDGLLQRFSRELLFVQRSTANVFRSRAARSTDILVKRVYVACGAYLLHDSEIGYYSNYVEKNDDIAVTALRHGISIANKSRARQATALGDAIDYSGLNTLYPLANLELRPLQEGAQPIVRMVSAKRPARSENRH